MPKGRLGRYIVEVIAQTMILVKLRQIYPDGAKIKTNASKHKVLSQGYIEKLKNQLRAEAREWISSLPRFSALMQAP